MLAGLSGTDSLGEGVCARCGHQNPGAARFCSSCGAALGAVDEDTTRTLSAVEAASVEDELEHYLGELPPGVGIGAASFSLSLGGRSRHVRPCVSVEVLAAIRFRIHADSLALAGLASHGARRS